MDGEHPFGDSLRRQANILSDDFDPTTLLASDQLLVFENLVSGLLRRFPSFVVVFRKALMAVTFTENRSGGARRAPSSSIRTFGSRSRSSPSSKRFRLDEFVAAKEYRRL